MNSKSVSASFDAMNRLDEKLFYAVFSHLPKGSLYPSLFVCKKWFDWIKNPEFLATRVHTGRLFQAITLKKDEFTADLLNEWQEVAKKCQKIALTEYLSAKDYNEALNFYSPELKEIRSLGTKIDKEFVTSLPVGLEALMIRLDEDESLFDFKFLPRGLKDLYIESLYSSKGAVDLLSDADIRSLPPNLRLLVLNGQYKISEHALLELPKTITHIRISACEGMTDSSLEEVPCHLRALSLDRCPLISRICLTSLKILVMSSCSNVDDATLELLPTSLEWLSVSNCSITDTGIQHLSRLQNLTKLNLEDSPCVKGLTLARLPSSLKDITLMSCKSLCDEALRNLHHLPKLASIWMSSLPISGTYFSSLPESLSVAKMHGLNNFDWRNLSCLKERKSLTKLSIHDRKGIPDIDLNHLPPSLVYLKLEGDLEDQRPNLSEIKKLKNLREFTLKELDLTHSEMTSLPVSLTSLNFLLSRITESQVSELTRLTNLESLNLSTTFGSPSFTMTALPPRLRQLKISRSFPISRLDPSVIHTNLLALELDSSQMTLEQIDDLKKKQRYLRVKVIRKRSY